MTQPCDVCKTMVEEMAAILDKLVDAMLRGGEADRNRLEEFLWDHKIGILRVLQAHGSLPNS